METNKRGVKPHYCIVYPFKYVLKLILNKERKKERKNTQYGVKEPL